MQKLVVMKFGGTSVGSADGIRDVAHIVSDAAQQHQVAVVVSAMSGVTDMLVKAAEAAEAKDRSAYRQNIEEIRTKHHEAAAQLGVSSHDSQKLIEAIEEHLVDLSDWLDGVHTMLSEAHSTRGLITSFGERLSVHLVVAALKQRDIAAKAVTASTCIITNENFGDAQPNLTLSTTHSEAVHYYFDDGLVPVVTGFLGATQEGIITTSDGRL